MGYVFILADKAWLHCIYFLSLMAAGMGSPSHGGKSISSYICFMNALLPLKMPYSLSARVAGTSAPCQFEHLATVSWSLIEFPIL